MPAETIDLREGYRIEVEPTLIPAGSYAARLYRPRKSASGRTTWKQIGPMVVSPHGGERAAQDLLSALNRGALPGVEASDGWR